MYYRYCYLIDSVANNVALMCSISGGSVAPWLVHLSLDLEVQVGALARDTV